MGHNTYQALLSDRYNGHQRSRAVTLYEVVTLFGSVVGAGIISKSLKTYEPAALLGLALGVAGAVVILATIAAIGQEPKTKVVETAAIHARQIPFRKVLSTVVFADPQVRLFFLLVLFTFIGTLGQDALLEPYGALVLNMDVGETSRLTMYWGLGVMASMLL